MKKRKLKGYVIPMAYSIAVCAIFASVLLLTSALKSFSIPENIIHVMNPLVDNVKPVVREETVEIIKPYYDTTVTIAKGFYSKDDEEKNQQSSLIYYQNTYMQNSGVLYSGPNIFDIVSVLDGKVINIKEDEILGNVVEIEHNSQLITSYHALGEIKVILGAEIKQGDIVGISGHTALNADSSNNLLFEVAFQGKNINPESFYSMNINELLNS